MKNKLTFAFNFVLDIIFWVGIYHFCLGTEYAYYAGNIVKFLIITKFIMSVVIVLGGAKLPKQSNFETQYVTFTTILECIVLSAFGNFMLAAMHLICGVISLGQREKSE